MSTGVGAGLVLGGRLWRGQHFQAGEIGHMPIEPGGRPCGCGMRGCLEAYVGGASLAARMREDLAAGASSALRDLAGGDPARVSARLWTRAIRAGDAYALALRDEFVARLAHGLAALVMILDPERIALGTIVSLNADLFLDRIRAALRERVWEEVRGVEVVAAALGPRLPAYAALSVALPEGSDA
jgi:glucokinase